jgi:hypothetical protein
MNADARTVNAGGEDAIAAALDLAKRSGWRSVEIGYKREGTATWRAGWYVTAIMANGHPVHLGDYASPVEAADALAEHILTGAKCRCGKPVAIGDRPARLLLPTTHLDGTTWGPDAVRELGTCRWRREGARWDSTCGAPAITITTEQMPQGPNRAQRRAAERARKGQGPAQTRIRRRRKGKR